MRFQCHHNGIVENHALGYRMWDYYIINRTSCAKANELLQNHCGDNQKGIVFMILYITVILLQQGLSTFCVMDRALPVQSKRLVHKFGLNLLLFERSRKIGRHRRIILSHDVVIRSHYYTISTRMTCHQNLLLMDSIRSKNKVYFCKMSRSQP